MLIRADVELLRTDIMRLPIHTYSQHYVTVLRYMSVPTFLEIQMFLCPRLLRQFKPPMKY